LRRDVSKRWHLMKDETLENRSRENEECGDGFIIPGLGNFISPKDFVYDQGVDFESATLDNDELQIVISAVDSYDEQFFKQNECYSNSIALVCHDKTKTLQYMEGFAANQPFMPVNHAWVAIHGKVIDLGPWHKLHCHLV